MTVTHYQELDLLQDQRNVNAEDAAHAAEAVQLRGLQNAGRDIGQAGVVDEDVETLGERKAHEGHRPERGLGMGEPAIHPVIEPQCRQ